MRAVRPPVRPSSRRRAGAIATGVGLLLTAAVVPAAADGAVPTQTTIRCAGIGTAGLRSCQVGVYADVPAGAPAPTGTISWTSSGPGSQTVTVECGINAYDRNVGPPFPNVIWCENGYTSPGELAPRTESVVATYSGDALYAGSVGTTTYYVRDPNGTIPEAVVPGGPAWRPQPSDGKDRPPAATGAAPTGPVVLSGLVAGPAGLTLASSGPAATVIRIERRIRRAGADGRTRSSWRTVRRFRRSVSGGANHIAVHLRPGVHRISIGGATVRRMQRTLTVRR